MRDLMAGNEAQVPQTVLNMAITVDGTYPIRAALRRLAEPVVRCRAGQEGRSAEFRTMEELLAPLAPGSPFVAAGLKTGVVPMNLLLVISTFVRETTPWVWMAPP